MATEAHAQESLAYHLRGMASSPCRLRGEEGNGGLVDTYSICIFVFIYTCVCMFVCVCMCVYVLCVYIYISYIPTTCCPSRPDGSGLRSHAPPPPLLSTTRRILTTGRMACPVEAEHAWGCGGAARAGPRREGARPRVIKAVILDRWGGSKFNTVHGQSVGAIAPGGAG